MVKNELAPLEGALLANVRGGKKEPDEPRTWRESAAEYGKQCVMMGGLFGAAAGKNGWASRAKAALAGCGVGLLSQAVEDGFDYLAKDPKQPEAPKPELEV